MTLALTLDMLQAFVKVAERASVSGAAAELGVGKGLVSKRVAQLEALLGSTLFARSTRHVALTPAGEAYLAHARRVLAELQGADESLRALRADLSGQIRVTAPVSWGQRVLARRLPEFLRLHPGITLELRLSDRVMDVAFEGVDLALRWTAASPVDLVSVPVSPVAWVVAAAPGYLVGAGTPQAPAELAAHPCMAYWRDGADDAWAFERDGAVERVQVRSRYHADNPEVVAEAALAGLGVALLPSYLCDEALAAGRLVALLPGWVPRTRFGAGICAVATPERLRVARNAALLAFLRERLAAE